MLSANKLIAATAATLALLGSAPAFALDILLTNDDGWDAPGIQQMHSTLQNAGHNVTLVAPLGPQSGRGGAMNIHMGSYVDVVQQADNVWSVDGTPVDAVRAGLDVILRDNPPDLIVSGSNFGQNLAAQTVHQSGTINAALEGLFKGYPAIAVSVGVDIDERADTPAFGSTLAAFEPTAELIVDLIETLQQRAGGDRILPAGIALNVNVPVPFEQHQGLRLAPLARSGGVVIHWQEGEEPFGEKGGQLQVMATFGDDANIADGSDIDLFRRGYITVTPLDARDDVLTAIPGLADALN